MRFCHFENRPTARVLAAIVAAVAVATLAGRAEETIPAVPWAIPLDGGPIRTLYIAPAETMRDAAQLSARTDLRLETAPLPDPAEMDAADDVFARLTRKLGRKWDLVILAAADPEELDAAFAAELAQNVADGTGLILSFFGDPLLPGALAPLFERLEVAQATDNVTEGLGARYAPEWYDGVTFAQCYTAGAGRVVVLDHPGARPLSHSLMPRLKAPILWEPGHSDTYYALFARAALWAAGRDAGLRVAGVAAARETTRDDAVPPPEVRWLDSSQLLAMDTVTASRYQARLQDPAPRDLDVTLQLREPRRGLAMRYALRAPLREAASSFNIFVPNLAGEALLDTWFMRRGRVVAWHTEHLNMPAPVTLGAVSLSADVLQPNDTLAVSAQVIPRAAGTTPVRVEAQATDGLGRLVARARTEASPQGGNVTLRLHFTDLMAPAVQVSVFAAPTADRSALRRGAFAQVWLRVDLPRNPYIPGLWTDALRPDELNCLEALPALRALGMNRALLSPELSGLAPILARHGFFTETTDASSGESRAMQRLGRSADSLTWSLWRGLANGTPDFLYTCDAAPPRLFGGLLNPGMEPAEDLARMLEEWGGLANGPAQLLLRSERLPGTIALFGRAADAGQAPDTDPAEGGELVRYRYGAAELALVLRGPEGDAKRESASLTFPRAAVVHDVLAGGRASRSGRVRTRLGRGQAALFAALPYEVSEMELAVPDEVLQGARLPVHVTLRTRGGLPGPHLVHLEVSNPAGALLRHYGRTIVCEDGSGETRIPFALNERPGRYLLTARDVLTGVEQAATVTVSAPGSVAPVQSWR